MGSYIPGLRGFLRDAGSMKCRYCGHQLVEMVVDTGFEVINFGWKAVLGGISWAECRDRPWWQRKLGCWTHRPRRKT